MSIASEGIEDTAEPADARPEEEEENENEPSLTQLLEQLGRELSALVLYETRLAAARHKPEIGRAARDVTVVLVTAVALLTAFAFANTAAVQALSTTLSDWLAPLVLAAAWAVIGTILALLIVRRARRSRAWTLEEAEAARAEAEQAVRNTVEQLAPVITKEIALAAVPTAGDMAEGLFDAGEEMIEAITDDIPGGGFVNQIWDIALMPGRLGIRVATTVLKRSDSGPVGGGAG
jgi:hypothetical protein